MRFRIIELLTIVSVTGFACVALKQSDPFFETVFFSFTLASLLAATLLAIGRHGGARAFWTGFAVSSISYLLFAHMPDADSMVPRHNGPELSTQLLRHGLNWLHAETYDSNLTSQPGGMFSVDDMNESITDDDPLGVITDFDDTQDEMGEPFPGNLSLIVGGGQRIVSDGRSISFMGIGHAAWALLFGWIGGHFTRTVFERSHRDRTIA